MEATHSSTTSHESRISPERPSSRRPAFEQDGNMAWVLMMPAIMFLMVLAVYWLTAMAH